MNAVTPPSIPSCTRPSARNPPDGITWDSMGIYGCQRDYVSTKWAKTGVSSRFHPRLKARFTSKNRISQKKTREKQAKTGEKRVRQSVSRVLYASKGCVVIIHLGCPLPDTSSNLPRRRPGNRSYAASIWSCSRRGLPCHCRYRQRGALLPHPFTLTLTGGLLSVALSLESPPPDVIRRRASVEPGLSSPACAGAITRLSDPVADYGESGPRSSAAWARHTA